MKSVKLKPIYHLLALLFMLSFEYLPAQQLPRSTPEKEGVPSQAIIDFINTANKSTSEFHSFMILRHGKVISEGWWNPYSPNLVHTLYSVSKSFTSTAIGFAVSEGKLSVNDKVISFFPDKLPDTISPYLAELKIKDLLTMSTGQFPEPTDTVRNSNDWVKTFLAQPFVYKPGTKFRYSSVATYMLSAIIQKVTGQKTIDYLSTRLFKPLGISGADWETDPDGVNTGGWGLRLHTEDLAKMGQFYLQQGKWKGKQLLPESWIAEATSKKIVEEVDDTTGAYENDWLQGYCYQFWRCTHNCFRADGAYGQYIVVMPEKDAVVAITAESGDLQGELSLVWQYLLPAFGDKPLPVNKSKNNELKKIAASLALPVFDKSESTDVSYFSGKEYILEKNDEDINTIAVRSKGEVIELSLDTKVIPFGSGKWEYGTTTRKGPGILRLKSTGQKYKTAGCYRWVDQNTLELKLRYIESPHSETIMLKYDNDNLVVEIKPSMPYSDTPVKLTGKVK